MVMDCCPDLTVMWVSPWPWPRSGLAESDVELLLACTNGELLTLLTVSAAEAVLNSGGVTKGTGSTPVASPNATPDEDPFSETGTEDFEEFRAERPGLASAGAWSWLISKVISCPPDLTVNELDSSWLDEALVAEGVRADPGVGGERCDSFSPGGWRQRLSGIGDMVVVMSTSTEILTFGMVSFASPPLVFATGGASSGAAACSPLASDPAA
mmetsp:Transcript_75210/g.121410  ORF Transcript_75210/g.121410 Transcript_75210/m.121410 type:complete len:212 (-) Transcript_75210:541-1176(-)